MLSAPTVGVYKIGMFPINVRLAIYELPSGRFFYAQRERKAGKFTACDEKVTVRSDDAKRCSVIVQVVPKYRERTAKYLQYDYLPKHRYAEAKE